MLDSLDLVGTVAERRKDITMYIDLNNAIRPMWEIASN